jgi:transposase
MYALNMDATLLPDDIATLKCIIADQNTVIAEHEVAAAERESVIADHEQLVAQLQEQVRLLKAWRFAASSEKAKKARGDDQYSLFDETELVAMQAESVPDVDGEEIETTEVASHSRRKKGRRPISGAYPRVEVVHDIPEEDKVCPCGCVLSRIGEEVSEKLDIVPQKIQVIRHVRPKYACRACEGVEDDGPTVKTAPMPPQLIPQGIVTPGLLAYILINKFADGLPFYRQSAMFARLGVDISRATMSNWTLRAAEACEPLLGLLYKQIRSGPIINLDETTVQVLKEPGRKNTCKSYMWVARGGEPNRPTVLFHYDPGRGGKVAGEIVGNFRGFLQTDGYAGYNALGKREGIRHVGCMAHVRRKFHDAAKSGTKKTNGTAQTVLDLIGKLYKLERQAREQKLEPEAVHAMRQERAKPIMDKIKNLLDARVKTTPPKSLLGRAISYALGQWERVMIYLEDGRLQPDNNAAENAIRPFAVGRKNWLFSGSPRGATASASIYSLIETAKACDLNPYEYLLHIFEQLPYVRCEDDLKTLLPQGKSKNDSA